jgi:hypothetical protein
LTALSVTFMDFAISGSSISSAKRKTKAVRCLDGNDRAARQTV